MADEQKELTLPFTAFSTANTDEINTELAKAGFGMVELPLTGHLLRIHGLPAIHTQLASEPNVSVNHMNKTVTFRSGQ